MTGGGGGGGSEEVVRTTTRETTTTTTRTKAGTEEISMAATAVETTTKVGASGEPESTTTTTTTAGMPRPKTRAELLLRFACLSWTGLSVALAALAVRFFCLWQQCVASRGETGWAAFHASVVLGTELALFAMAVMIVLMVPRMIMTWTTTVVFEYVFGVLLSGKVRRGQVVADGKRSAKEISRLTVADIFEEGNAVLATVLLVCFTATIMLRQSIALE